MNGFETVEKLKELEKKATPHTHYLEDICHTTVGSAESDLVLRNAAPLLLDIAGQIRPEDKEMFGLVILLCKTAGCHEDSATIDFLRRYQNMAEKMNNWR